MDGAPLTMRGLLEDAAQNQKPEPDAQMKLPLPPTILHRELSADTSPPYRWRGDPVVGRSARDLPREEVRRGVEVALQGLGAEGQE